MLTKHQLSFLLPVLLGTLCGSAGAASRLELLPAQAGDLAAPAALARSSRMSMAMAAPEGRRDAVAVSWAAGAQPLAKPVPFAGESREYYTEVSGAELAAGVAIRTSAAQAVVRVQPTGAASARGVKPIDPRAIGVRTAQGKDFNNGAGMDMLVDADRLAKAGHGFAQGTSAFRLHPSLGAGSFTLRADAPADAGARYLVNVVEPASTVALTLRTDAVHYLHGQELVIHADALEPAARAAMPGAALQRRTLDKMAAVLVSPAGRTFPLEFKRGRDGLLTARHQLNADENPAPGLWEVRAGAEAGSGNTAVKRTLRMGVAVAMPQARFDGNVNLIDQADKLVARFGVEVGAGGRYEVRALLYGMVNGAIAPVAVAHSAAWLEPGAGNIELAYDAALLAGVRGPYELRDLSLLDQSRVGLLHRQQRGLVIDEREALRTGLRVAQSAAGGTAAIPRKPAQ
ncbi:DUF4785 domain-containing protein [Massilia pseudoviolaceinigra]|uniref:DUF4785 domain-containing protein n=1 Tax=Massilia pseudoviolaceinigra TaxID=3057165 RepID=UPI00279654CB|nr:DUF4785 domain-containing protein [Massilia sp. CCM 9206]MDQ1920722.1 DUF4785 family protein [Massilia sp. CCM 9206]